MPSLSWFITMSIKTKIAIIIPRIKNVFNSRRGRNILVFMIFVFISAILWLVMTLNEEVQQDLRCPIRVVNRPDSVNLVSTLPDGINVSIKAKGTQLLKYQWSDAPVIEVNYKAYANRNKIALSEGDLKNIVRNIFGSNAQILAINPDTLNMVFTELAPRRLPVRIDSRITTISKCVISGPLRLSRDSVRVYSAGPLPSDVRSVSTKPIQLTNISESKKLRVALVAPPNCRVEPDSVDVYIDVEPMISVSQQQAITTINVPKNKRLILMTPVVEVNYLVPMSRYNDKRASVSVVADYNSIAVDKSTNNMIKVNVVCPSESRGNVYLNVDSVEFIIENR